ncbi:hypothetical protein D9758_006531 [Tetrapyrgos nigripes]|uniref:Uncharacterized protein n=1 Tax=Tetrapyrgos nigripes TaxID=182062 RepID=A0A8H5GKT4_9AGAR|nr:hypothetical protein D9758_006531 [Tetrapyrgos nigripes]
MLTNGSTKAKPSTRYIIGIQRFCSSGYIPGMMNPNSNLSLPTSTSDCNSDFSPNNSSSNDGKGKELESKSWPTEKRDRGLHLVVIGSEPSESDISAVLAERVEVENVVWSVSGDADGAGAGAYPEANDS